MDLFMDGLHHLFIWQGHIWISGSQNRSAHTQMYPLLRNSYAHDIQTEPKQRLTIHNLHGNKDRDNLLNKRAFSFFVVVLR